jgi:hypothetical protein
MGPTLTPDPAAEHAHFGAGRVAACCPDLDRPGDLSPQRDAAAQQVLSQRAEPLRWEGPKVRIVPPG